jgi:hypothetical protein
MVGGAQIRAVQIMDGGAVNDVSRSAVWTPLPLTLMFGCLDVHSLLPPLDKKVKPLTFALVRVAPTYCVEIRPLSIGAEQRSKCRRVRGNTIITGEFSGIRFFIRDDDHVLLVFR